MGGQSTVISLELPEYFFPFFSRLHVSPVPATAIQVLLILLALSMTSSRNPSSFPSRSSSCWELPHFNPVFTTNMLLLLLRRQQEDTTCVRPTQAGPSSLSDKSNFATLITSSSSRSSRVSCPAIALVSGPLKWGYAADFAVSLL